MAVETGDYTVLFYDEKNSRVTTIKDKADSLSLAREKGDLGVVTYDNIKSYVVDRRIFNSLDTGGDKWG